MKFRSPIDVDGYISLITQNPGVTPTKFLIQDANGRIAFRTGQELKVDIGAGYTSVLKHQVKAGVAINKGQAVYVTSADGTNMIVGLASNNSEATSSKTMGLLNATVAANGFADVITEGLLAGLNTIGANAGDPVWLGTNGNLIYGLTNKPYAPNHLVFIGIVTRVNANNGEIFVKVQNGFELDELHDVDLKTTTKVYGHILGYNGALWVNKTIAGWLGFTPADDTQVVHKTGDEEIFGSKTFYDIAAFYGGLYANYIDSGSVNSSGPVFGEIFYDTYNSAYYMQPGYITNLNYLQVEQTINGNISGNADTVDGYHVSTAGNANTIPTRNGSGYLSPANWIQLDGDYGLYSPNNGAHFYPNNSSYGAWKIQGTRNGWGGLEFVTNSNGNVSLMIGTNSATTGLHNNSYGWQIRWDNGSLYSGRSTYGGNDTRVLQDDVWITGKYFGSDGVIYAERFYDANNGSYYVDPASTSNLNAITTVGSIAVGTSSSGSYKFYVAGGQYGTYLRGGDSGTGSDILRLVDVFDNTKYLARGDGKHFFTGNVDIQGNIAVSGSASFAGNSSWFGGYGASSGLAFENQSSFARIVFWNLDFYEWDSGQIMTMNNGYVQANNSFRAPVFYDSNDTSYFFDGSSTGDSIRVAGDIVAYYSDERLKDKKGNIENALDKVLSLNGFYYTPNARAQELGYKYKEEVGVSAQEVEAILPQIIKDAPIGQGYKTLDYGKLTPLLIEAIKEQNKKVEDLKFELLELKQLVNQLINK